MPDFARLAAVLPLAGAIIAAPAAATLLALWAIGAPSLYAALLAIAVGLLTSGAFHEDGLADTADGLGGGRTRERKLEIMKDSRIGTFGGVALVVSIGARAAALGAIVDHSGGMAGAGAMVLVGAVARLTALAPLTLLPPARLDGAAWNAAKPTFGSLAIGACVAAAIAALAARFAGLPPCALAVGAAAALAAALAMTGIARRQIGGQTGDIAGAAEQLGEIALLGALTIPALQ